MLKSQLKIQQNSAKFEVKSKFGRPKIKVSSKLKYMLISIRDVDEQWIISVVFVGLATLTDAH